MGAAMCVPGASASECAADLGPPMDAREFRLRVMASELERTTCRAEQAEAHVALLTRSCEEQRATQEAALLAANEAHRDEIEAWRQRMVRDAGSC